MVVVAGDHLVDLGGADQGLVAGQDPALRGGRQGAGVDGEEAAIEAALDHTRIVDLAAVHLHVVAVHDAVAGTPEAGRDVEVAVEDDHRLVQGHGLGRHPGGPGRRRSLNSAGEGHESRPCGKTDDELGQGRAPRGRR